MLFVSISYKNHKGFLNIDNNEIYIYNYKYINIIDAIINLEQDIENHQEEIKIFEKLLNELLIDS